MDLETLEALTDNDLILARDARAHGLGDHLRHASDRGRFVRIRRGAYVATSRWQKLGVEERHSLVVHAVHATRERPVVFSHWSAAVAWGLPVVGGRLGSVHVIEDTAAGGRSGSGIVRHPGLERLAPQTHRGLAVTSVVDTVIDIASTSPFAAAVAVADAALHVPRRGSAMCSREELMQDLERLRGRKGERRAFAVVRFADGRAESPGESTSRANIHLGGFIAPDLQCAIYDAAGLIGYTDFYWESVRLVGEFDGAGKYLKEEYLRGRSTADVVLAEKKREDRLRAIGLGVARWDWDVALHPDRLYRRLAEANVPRVRRR
ncbi:hypothetical protein [Humibacter sp. RRB41]|uniref:hypothetical protein n=1 Tax=Humibacter sp. RRB41 TaxID=2919946 RepID=UPI001FAAA4C5|nr:hypothetical protein [Humibacter sp. RRB41]